TRAGPGTRASPAATARTSGAHDDGVARADDRRPLSYKKRPGARRSRAPAAHATPPLEHALRIALDDAAARVARTRHRTHVAPANGGRRHYVQAAALGRRGHARRAAREVSRSARRHGRRRARTGCAGTFL